MELLILASAASPRQMKEALPIGASENGHEPHRSPLIPGRGPSTPLWPSWRRARRQPHRLLPQGIDVWARRHRRVLPGLRRVHPHRCPGRGLPVAEFSMSCASRAGVDPFESGTGVVAAIEASSRRTPGDRRAVVTRRDNA